MKKSRVIMAIGTLLLAATAIFATKANKKSTGFTTAVFGSTDQYGLHAIGATYGLILTTIGSHQLNARMYTSANFSNAVGGLLTKPSESKTVFYH
jgi:hypothetical protein